MMRAVDSTRRRLQSAVDLASELAKGDFPNEHARDALIELRSAFSDGLSALGLISPSTDPASAKALCAAESAKLFALFPYLGFLSHSTDTRNAFEIHGPLLRLIRKFLDPDTRLVVSSEWDYSPFTFIPPRHAVLSGTVMIGAPASESWNALTLPLAGHELGHNIWARQNLGAALGPRIQEAICSHVETAGWASFQRIFQITTGPASVRTDLVVQSKLAPAFEWARAQCEEVFCDCLGLLIFSESFLHAFHYLLAPCLPYPRSFHYPPTLRRAVLLERAAISSGINVHKGYVDEFDDEAAPTEPTIGTLLSIADFATESMMSELLSIAQGLVSAAGIATPSADQRQRIASCFAMCVPPQNAPSLPAIVNGAWDYYLSGMAEWRWQYPDVFTSNRSLEMLSDLAFKSIEIHEIEEKLR